LISLRGPLFLPGAAGSPAPYPSLYYSESVSYILNSIVQPKFSGIFIEMVDVFDLVFHKNLIDQHSLENQKKILARNLDFGKGW
jgi:hypothetical protein